MHVCIQKAIIRWITKDLRARTPIIIVPAAATSVINTFNAQDFLEGYK